MRIRVLVARIVDHTMEKKYKKMAMRKTERMNELYFIQEHTKTSIAYV